MSHVKSICAVCGVDAETRSGRCSRCGAPQFFSFLQEADLHGWAPAQAAECVLTAKDHGLLEACVQRHPHHDRYVLFEARQKLSKSRVVLTEDVAPDIVTLNSRIAYSVDQRPTEVCVLGHWDEEGGADGRIALRTRRGVALLGMRAGALCKVLRLDRSIEQIRVQEVLYQPEQARRSGRRVASGRCDLKIRETPMSANIESLSSHRTKRGAPPPRDDDPGPSAA